MSDYIMLSRGQEIIDSFNKKLSSMRVGRVNAAILDSVNVEAYNSKMKIKELATITVPEPNQLWITPFERTYNWCC